MTHYEIVGLGERAMQQLFWLGVGLGCLSYRDGSVDDEGLDRYNSAYNTHEMTSRYRRQCSEIDRRFSNERVVNSATCHGGAVEDGSGENRKDD